MRLKLNLIDGNYTQAVADSGSCAYKINVCEADQTVVSSILATSAESGDPGAIPVAYRGVLNSDCTVDIIPTMWVQIVAVPVTIKCLVDCS